jgi:hypothetical protein
MPGHTQVTHFPHTSEQGDYVRQWTDGGIPEPTQSALELSSTKLATFTPRIAMECDFPRLFAFPTLITQQTPVKAG